MTPWHCFSDVAVAAFPFKAKAAHLTVLTYYASVFCPTFLRLQIKISRPRLLLRRVVFLKDGLGYYLSLFQEPDFLPSDFKTSVILNGLLDAKI